MSLMPVSGSIVSRWFRLSRKIGVREECVFLGFGTVNGPDGRPLKTRSGNPLSLTDLLQDVVGAVKECVQAKGRNLDDETVHSIAMSAIKIADLQQDLRHSYEFSLERCVQFEGKTGPYLLYVCARINSLLEKGSYDKEAPIHCDDWAAEERALAIELLKFPEVVLSAARQHAPHILCQYAFAVAFAFNTFYQSMPVIVPEEKVRAFRLRLCERTHECLTNVLYMLGIKAPQHM